MRKRLLLWYTIALAVAAAVIVIFPVVGLSSASNAHFPLRTAWCVAILIFQIGATWYFVASLPSFKPVLRRAYKELSLGILCLGLAQVQLPILTYINGWSSWYARGGIVLLPYVATTVAMYLGVRTFARIMQVRSAWMQWWLAMLASFGGIGVTLAIFGRYEHSVASFAYDSLIGWSVAGGLITAWITLRVRASLSPTFKPAMNWLLASFIATIIAGLHQLWLQHFTSETWWYRDDGFSVWLLLVASMAFLRTGLEFWQLTRGLVSNTNFVEVVVYTAQLASRPQDIDPILDRLRLLTAGLRPGAALTDDTRRQLIEIYLELENYLVNQERLRNFTRHSLRLGLPDSFVAQLPPAA